MTSGNLIIGVDNSKPTSCRVSTQKVAVMATASITGQNELTINCPCSICTKGISKTIPKDHRRELLLFMALTFGTLLSSQGADAHRHDPFGAIRGNPRHATPVGRSRSNALSGQLPTWSPHTFGPLTAARGASHLGDVRPAPRGTSAILLAEALRSGPLWLRPSNKENISQRARRESNPLGKASGGPGLLGYTRLGRLVDLLPSRVRSL
jgi:hypothetical protein